MFPWGAIIGLAGQAVSGSLSITNNRRIKQEADAESARQRAFYEAKANENPLSRSEVQHVLGQYDRSSQQQLENARSVAAIKGSTPEFAASVQKGVAEGRANLMGQVSAESSQRADYYNMLGEQAKHQKAQEDMQHRMQRNSTYAALAGNSASAVGAIMEGYSAQQPKGGGTNYDGGTVDVGQSTAEKIANAPSRAAQLQAGAEAATNQVDKQVLTDTANAAANEQKLASATPPKKNVLASGSTAKLTDGGYIQNADGTYTKDGVLYYRNFDGSYAKVN